MVALGAEAISPLQTQRGIGKFLRKLAERQNHLQCSFEEKMFGLLHTPNLRPYSNLRLVLRAVPPSEKTAQFFSGANFLYGCFLLLELSKNRKFCANYFHDYISPVCWCVRIILKEV